MAHSALHVSFGVILGSIVALPPLVRSWRAGDRLADRFGNWILLSCVLGLYAVVPGLLRRAGVPDAVCDGWWMNLFLFYPALNSWIHGGVVYGVVAVVSVFVLLYALLVAALRPRACPRENENARLNSDRSKCQ